MILFQRNVVVFYVIIVISFLSCNKDDNKIIPDNIGTKALSEVIEGDSAKTIIDKLHQSNVSATKNIIANYGEQDKDILYLSIFNNENKAKDSFELMLDKIKQNTNKPFKYLVPMKNYDEKSYMTLGMGFVHYIYKSGKNVIWLSTKQKFFNEIPENLTNLYPVK